MARVAIVIPNWNGASLLPETLEALREQSYRDFEVVLVDNASTDDSLGIVRASFPEVRCITLDRNVGFAAGVNAGIRATEGELVVLLNNDAVPEADWLERLVEAADRNPEIGSFASRILSYRDPSVIDSAGDQLGLFPSQIGHGRKDGPAYREPALVFSACACAAAYRRAMLDVIGLFDERFFAYMEDVDIGARAQLAGFDCLYVPRAVVRHHGSVTANRVPEFKFYLHMRNALYVFFQYMPGRRLVWAPVVLISPFLVALRERQSLRVAARALLDFVRDARRVLARRTEVAREAVLDASDLESRLAPPIQTFLTRWVAKPYEARRSLAGAAAASRVGPR